LKKGRNRDYIEDASQKRQFRAAPAVLVPCLMNRRPAMSPGIGVPRRRDRVAVRARAVLSALVLLAGCFMAVAVTMVATSPRASAGTAPPPPSGWTTVFSDNFAGPAGSAPNPQNWFYDIGTGFGTGEIENMTNSTGNVHLDGNGDLDITAIDNGGTWTSGRIESTRDDFEAPPGGEMEMTASIEQPNPADGLGYWPAFWALGSPGRTGGSWPTEGEIDMMEDVNGLNEASQTLHDSANSPGHALIACPTTGCQTGYNTYSVIVNRVNTSAEYLEFLMDGTVEDTITEASVGTTAWQDAIDHGFFIIFDLAMGGNYPDGICNCTAPSSATTSGGTMSVQYVAVYEEGGNSTPTATQTAAGQVTGLDGLCLTNQNSLNTEGNPMYVSSCNGSAGQQWATYSDNTVRTQGGCLDVVSAGTTSGTDVDWYPCNGTAAQNWTKEANGELVNPNSGLCLTDPGGNTGSRLDIETCAASAEQLWTLPAGSGGANTVTVTNPGNQSSTVNTAASLQINATDSASGQTLTYSASGLPAGLSINSSTGLISGTPTTAATSTVTVTATDGTGATGSTTFSWTVGSGGSSTCGAANVALDQPTTASSVQSTSFPAADATDGSTSTRWSSAFSDPQWLEVDLGETMTVCRVTLDWEAAYATAFQIQTSNDGSTWTTIYSTTTGTGGDQTLSVSGAGRYIRMYGTTRATQYGYSLWEFQVFASSPPATIVTAASYTSSNSVQTEATADPCCTDDVGYINSGSWLEYTGVNFGSGLTGQLEVRMASGVSGTDIGTIQFRLGSLTATPFATVEVSGTGGWQTWVDTTPVTASPVPSGTQTLYVTFTTSAGGNFVNVNYFRFT
jgi:hypothetical protein